MCFSFISAAKTHLTQIDPSPSLKFSVKAKYGYILGIFFFIFLNPNLSPPLLLAACSSISNSKKPPNLTMVLTNNQL